jgi:non-lysosomal glucosylceramidase
VVFTPVAGFIHGREKSMRYATLLSALLLISGQSVANAQLFDPAASTREWTRFAAKGYKAPVAGMIFTDKDEVCAGMPLGGLGTGCLDIETSGVLGFSSIFFPSKMVDPTPYQTLRNAQFLTPFLGIAIGGETWVLASQKMIDGGTFRGCIDPVDPGDYTQNENYMSHWRVEVPKTEGVKAADSIRYFGHYPVADIDYTTDAPVQVSLRAWSPFLPGHATDSAIPVAVFEVRLRNTSSSKQSGKLAFNFPDLHPNEAKDKTFERKVAQQDGWQAVEISTDRVSYAMAALDEPSIEFGGNLSVGGNKWSKFGKQLPQASKDDSGASLAVPFEVEPNAEKTIRIVLAWHAKSWLGGAYDEIKHFDETWTTNDFVLSRVGRNERSTYIPNYTRIYDGPLAVVRDIAQRRQELLTRIIAWQSEIYTEDSLPVWLRSALVNNLSQFAEDSIWAAPVGELADWAAPLGAFQMIECPRTCAIVGCTASNYYGDLPIAYFFPELERQILRGYAAYQRPDGAIPFLYPPQDFTKPAYEWQIGLNGACFADLVHRLWMRTGDDEILREFYPVVKKNTEFTVGLASGKHGIISFHREGKGQEWWEHTPVYGMVTHLAGVRLAQLRFAQDMAEHVGDDGFARKCASWIDEARKLTEEHLWNDKTQSYAFFVYPEKDMRSDDIMSSQLDGQWMVDLHGMPAIFRQDRIEATLATIADTCLVDMGVAGFAEPGKGPDLERYGTFPPEVIIVAMTYIYQGQRDLGLEIARRSMDNMIRVQGLGWDMPNLIRCDTGARTYGADYYQNMILWGLPAALAGQDLAGPCKSDGIVTQVIRAAAGNE